MDVNVGDRITFKSATRDSCKKATRKVNGFHYTTGEPTVSYNGWDDFVVHWCEITEVEK